MVIIMSFLLLGAGGGRSAGVAPSLSSSNVDITGRYWQAIFQQAVIAGSGSPVVIADGHTTTLGTPVLTDSGRIWTYPITNGNPSGDPILFDAETRLTAATGVWKIGSVQSAAITNLLVTNNSESTQVTIITDNFNRSDSAAGGVSNGWSDNNTIWSIDTNKAEASTAGFGANHLYRGLDKADVRSRVSVNIPGDNSVLVWARMTSLTGTGYATWISAGAINLARLSAGGPVTIYSTSYSSGSTEFDLQIMAANDMIVGSMYEVDGTTPLAEVDLRSSTIASGDFSFTPLANNNTIDNFTGTHTATITDYLVGDGDSITAGATAGTAGWVGFAINRLGYRWSGTNVGVSGQTTVDMEADFITEVGAIISGLGAGITPTYVIAGGTNDFYLDDASAATLQTRVSTLITTAKANGATNVAVVTILPRNDFPGTSTIPGNAAAQLAAFDSRRATYNAWLIANAVSLGVTVIGWAADARMDDVNDATVYNGDLVHPNQRGESYLGEDVANALA